ncbi:uncharacterized protein E0L32_011609 [Thyridium curvatum]|uniref:Uncharacterized protein n=1 Tax=Thyridium curvatum TaxID=1093900 RepID=A0A507BGL3_9PEZI|nr:uncharacterized protein E0L32_011609 [Thyridium curvatum]TPX18496.1 hypothetical protein E0L32_011609 [Thyridium curvatum]
MSLQGKVALITGASKGIGKAVALRLASEGASVVVGYGTDKAAADAVVAEIGGPDRAVAVGADASRVADIERLVSAAVARFGRIDVLVPNAGRMAMRTVEDTTEGDFDSMFAVNVKGPYFLVQKALPHMPPGSKVVLVSTTVAAFSSVAPPYLLYAATKGAVEQMTRVLAKGLGAKGITVNAVAPGPTATELFYEGKSEQLVNAIKGANPFNKIGEPNDVAEVFAFLSRPESSWMTGQVVRVNGGMA